ncbi:MAG: hypothetical protein OEV92_08060 [Nitrospinota bacterium]|nr:hypothetical protein [Nitrospinota bacterium]
MVIDPSLTQSEFNGFVKEVAPMLYFRPMAGAKPLGEFKFEVSIELWKTGPLQDYAGKWNNTFSHQDSEHWLTDEDHRLNFPVPRARMGITNKMDAEIFYAPSPANYKFFGLAVKYAVLTETETGWDFAVRPSYSTLLGVADVAYDSLAVDALASTQLGLFRPYLGATAIYGKGSETTSKVNLNDVSVTQLELSGGVGFNWKYLSMALEANLGVINVYSFKLGATF